MSAHNDQDRALFPWPDSNIYPDSMVCSGLIPPELGGKPCPYAQDGRMPDLLPLEKDRSDNNPDKGQPGDLCPPCAKEQLGPLAQWQGHRGRQFPAGLLPLRLFKCRQWFWLVVPGLRDDSPTRLGDVGETP